MAHKAKPMRVVCVPTGTPSREALFAVYREFGLERILAAVMADKPAESCSRPGPGGIPAANGL